MSDEIIRFIASYILISEEEIRVIEAQNLIKTFKKDTILLSEGEYENKCYFILKGCVRSYYLVEGEEKTTEFYTESQTITPVSYVTKKPSEYYISCLEDCIIALGDPERNKSLIEQIPKLENLVLQLNSKLLVQNQITADSFKKLSPEGRYLNLLNTRPDLIKRVPQYHLATYLGITPVSLSRMRKRISVKP